ncbi:MAG: cyclic nucleotide-binding domain-containing protein [Bdellovibrionota bacterium]
MSGIKISEEFFKKFGKRFPPESFLAREGEPGDTMFLINTGKVAVIKKTPAGEKILATLSDGDFFGEMVLMGVQDRRAATVKTLTEVTVLELNRLAFESLIKRSPEIAMKVISTLAERVRDSNGKLTALVHKNDFIRTAAFIQHLANDKGIKCSPEETGRVLIFKREAAVQALGVSLDQIDRFLTLARKVRFVAQNGEWLWVPYPSYLLPFGELLAKLT